MLVDAVTMAHKRKEPSLSSLATAAAASSTNNGESTSNGIGDDDSIHVRRPRLLSSLIHTREYHGTYHGGSVPCVTITDVTCIEELHVRGCYGKPSLSRGEPNVITGNLYQHQPPALI